MRPTHSILSACLGLCLAIVGCASRPPNPSAAPPPLPGGAGVPLLDDEQVAAARTLYIAKCASCHKFYPPGNYSEAEWNSWMRKMSRKAKLKPTEEETLRNYLRLFRR